MGFFTLLDATRSRLFQYDSGSNLLYAFGIKGTQQGTFNNPVAVENQGDCILVLDAGLGGIHVLQPTVFGQGVRTAITLYNDGRYEDAAGYWERILSQDAYYALANIGMGKVHERTGNFTLAMRYYRAGSDRDGYSSAFLARREAFTRDNFLLILIGVIIMLSACNDGIGGDHFYHQLADEPDIQKTMDLFLSRGRNETAPDQWQSQILARILLKVSVVYVSNMPDEMVKKMHMIPAHSIGEAMEKAKALLGKEDPTVTAIPDGISVVVRK